MILTFTGLVKKPDCWIFQIIKNATKNLQVLLHMHRKHNITTGSCSGWNLHESTFMLVASSLICMLCMTLRRWWKRHSWKLCCLKVQWDSACAWGDFTAILQHADCPAILLLFKFHSTTNSSRLGEQCSIASQMPASYLPGSFFWYCMLRLHAMHAVWF